jgi:hypothetical protein
MRLLSVSERSCAGVLRKAIPTVYVRWPRTFYCKQNMNIRMFKVRTTFLERLIIILTNTKCKIISNSATYFSLHVMRWCDVIFSVRSTFSCGGAVEFSDSKLSFFYTLALNSQWASSLFNIATFSSACLQFVVLERESVLVCSTGTGICSRFLFSDAQYESWSNRSHVHLPKLWPLRFSIHWTDGGGVCLSFLSSNSGRSNNICFRDMLIPTTPEKIHVRFRLKNPPIWDKIFR